MQCYISSSEVNEPVQIITTFRDLEASGRHQHKSLIMLSLRKDELISNVKLVNHLPSLPNFRFFLEELEDFDDVVEALVLLEDEVLSLFFHRINMVQSLMSLFLLYCHCCTSPLYCHCCISLVNSTIICKSFTVFHLRFNVRLITSVLNG